MLIGVPARWSDRFDHRNGPRQDSGEQVGGARVKLRGCPPSPTLPGTSMAMLTTGSPPGGPFFLRLYSITLLRSASGGYRPPLSFVTSLAIGNSLLRISDLGLRTLFLVTAFRCRRNIGANRRAVAGVKSRGRLMACCSRYRWQESKTGKRHSPLCFRVLHKGIPNKARPKVFRHYKDDAYINADDVRIIPLG